MIGWLEGKEVQLTVLAENGVWSIHTWIAIDITKG